MKSFSPKTLGFVGYVPVLLNAEAVVFKVAA
jgi:hypothetical protein